MTYGDSESNYHRINDITTQLSNLESDLNTFRNEINFEISDLKESVATNSSAIADLQKFTADLLKNFPVVLGSVKAVKDIANQEISDLRESLKAVRDIAMAEIIAIKKDIDTLECSSITDANLIKALTKTTENLRGTQHIHEEIIDKDSLWYRITELEQTIEGLDRRFMSEKTALLDQILEQEKIFPMIQTTLENHQSIIAMIQTTLVELKENQEHS